MRKSCEMGSGRMREEDDGEGGDLSFKLFQLLNIKALIPAHINEDFDASVELE